MKLTDWLLALFAVGSIAFAFWKIYNQPPVFPSSGESIFEPNKVEELSNGR